eukprot:4232068-Alexandrium_andersonii.AAC.1
MPPAPAEPALAHAHLSPGHWPGHRDCAAGVGRRAGLQGRGGLGRGDRGGRGHGGRRGEREDAVEAQGPGACGADA